MAACAREDRGRLAPVRRVVDRLVDYFGAVMIYAISTFYLIVTIVARPSVLLRPKDLRHEWFLRFYGFMGPACSSKPAIHRTTAALLAPTAGLVIDIGPGQGVELAHLAPAAPHITRVYGLEPNTAQHPALRAQVARAGLSDKYAVLPISAAPAEMVPAMVRNDVHAGSVDRVVSVIALCSCPRQEVEGILKVVHALLRPGGEFVFVEHVANRTDKVSGCLQRFLDRTWPYFCGGCRLQGQLEVILERMDGWAGVEVSPIPGSQGFECIPFVSGRAVKASREKV